ncbi:unnamed protein product [Didymodactylos carnosus]|uniref:G-protein coupled receptors family 1 profile domain-containing protein n=1 Tax=Didymodactylos carnosus TaxID=1234261 RepID=A0A813ZPL0_9BILA|nr:unnamed protein product [Didymodactylos carnosus]CAF1218313.1 unnamed protein product [Didymodactylos carnosus]CAF3683761.1 unnamed protein product [Didymodactylos carnosus]CAF4026553.1 unnamed protein product [Didymodactylos carnosus]
MYSSSYTIKLKITYLIKFHSYSYSLSTINYNQIGTTIVYKKIVLLSSSNVVIVELASSSSKFQYRQILEQLLFSSAISLDSDTTFIYRVSEYLLKVYPVIMLILGVFGNALSFCVLIRQSMRRYSTFCYLACLALVDIGVILTFCINFILLYHLKYDMQEKAFACKLFAFCTYFLPQYSSWLLVAVSFDRVISAKYLKLAKTWTRPKQSLVIMIALGLILALINIHFFFYKNYSIQLPTKIITTTLSNINGNRSVSYEPQLAHFSDDQTSFSYDSLSFTEAVPDTGQLKSYYADTTMASVLPIKSSPNIIVIDDTFKIPDVNIIHCSLENDPRLEWLYPYWAWIDLLMNVIIPFTGINICFELYRDISNPLL